MKRYECEMCSKKVLMVHDHHIIPYWFSHDDSESNIMRLCPTCHSRADTNFNSLILRGKIDVSDATDKRAATRYIKKYRRAKMLYHIKLLNCIYYYDLLYYNIKTGSIIITHSWNKARWNKIRNRHVIMVAGSRRKMIKAAAVKSQTTL